MNLLEIREEVQDIARDTEGENTYRLWTDAELNRYINRIYRYIARETRCIRDSTTTDVCLIPVTVVDYTTYQAGTIDYTWANDPASWLYHQNVAPYLFTYHPSIIEIEECKWTTWTWKLTKVSVRKWQTNPWWEQVMGMPTEFCTDLQNGKIAINFRSQAEDTLRMVVRRLPLVDLINDEDIPEIKYSYHDYFINGVLWQMYSKQDAEIIDKGKAAEFRSLFLLDIDEIKQQEAILDERLNVSHSLLAFR